MFNSGDRVGNLLLLDQLGSGAFGVVFRARDALLDRECAVKFVPNKDPHAFKAHLEGKILHRCQHDHIVKVYDVNAYNRNSQLFAGIEMELMEDGSAEDLVKREFVSCRGAIRIVIDSLFALEHAHANGILHRDYKPPNIMLCKTGAKLSDFGVAASVDDTLMGSKAGSPVYCAPEVFSKNFTDPVTEVYSVGISLFQLLNNIDDWDALIPDIKIIEEGRTISFVGYEAYVPRRLRMICNKACAVERDRRYQTARELRQALESVHIAIDWRRTGAHEWEGRAENRIHNMIVEGAGPYRNTYRVNNRRVTANCSRHAEMTEAELSQEKIVYRTTF